jgi:hypothetical protein
MTEKLYTFTCKICDGYKESQKMYQERVNGIGIDPKKLCKICDNCIKWVNIIKPPKDEGFF